jgi:hypothetical protein
MFRSVRSGYTIGRHQTYAYSFDHETFTGAFATREEAYRAAVARASGMEDTPAEIFVGERVPADPQADGHATELLKSMARRARAAAGEGADEYLRRVNDQQEAELDEAVERVVVEWLTKHEMMPTFADVRAISEYPMPALTGAPDAGLVRSPEMEVTEIGTSDYSPNR